MLCQIDLASQQFGYCNAVHYYYTINADGLCQTIILTPSKGLMQGQAIELSELTSAVIGTMDRDKISKTLEQIKLSTEIESKQVQWLIYALLCRLAQLESKAQCEEKRSIIANLEEHQEWNSTTLVNLERKLQMANSTIAKLEGAQQEKDATIDKLKKQAQIFKGERRQLVQNPRDRKKTIDDLEGRLGEKFWMKTSFLTVTGITVLLAIVGLLSAANNFDISTEWTFLLASAIVGLLAIILIILIFIKCWKSRQVPVDAVQEQPVGDQLMDINQ